MDVLNSTTVRNTLPGLLPIPYINHLLHINFTMRTNIVIDDELMQQMLFGISRLFRLQCT